MSSAEIDYAAVIASTMADNTRISYARGWRLFEAYCKKNKCKSLPASHDDIANFLIEVANTPGPTGKRRSYGTITMWRSAIGRRHTDHNFISPTTHPHVNRVMKGIARLVGTTQRQVKALREHHIKAMIEQCPHTPIGYRDAAIIAIGFSAALRRAEICALKITDIEKIPDMEPPCIFVHIRQSKTDQAGAGQKVAIQEGDNIKPLYRLKKWLAVSEIKTGLLFRTMSRGGGLRAGGMHHSDIPRIVKHYVKMIGLDESEFAAHSLRAGFVTSAAVAGARIDKIMEVTRHKNPSMVLKYIRDADSFKDMAGATFL